MPDVPQPRLSLESAAAVQPFAGALRLLDQDDLGARLRGLRALMIEAHLTLVDEVRQALASGLTTEAVGAHLGVTRQAAWQMASQRDGSAAKAARRRFVTAVQVEAAMLGAAATDQAEAAA